jgi:hypothetical protein
VCDLGEAYEALLRGQREPTLDAAAIRRFAAAHAGGAWHWRTRSPEALLRLAGED